VGGERPRRRAAEADAPRKIRGIYAKQPPGGKHLACRLFGRDLDKPAIKPIVDFINEFGFVLPKMGAQSITRCINH
jgi:hypothetical protein